MSDAAAQLIDDVVSANHILYNEGVVDRVPHLRRALHPHLGENTPVFEIRDGFGEASDLLIRSQEMREALAKSLGGAAAAMNDEHLERPWQLWKLAAQRDRVRA